MVTLPRALAVSLAGLFGLALMAASAPEPQTSGRTGAEEPTVEPPSGKTCSVEEESEEAADKEAPRAVLVIHGGAGVRPKKEMTDKLRAEYEAALKKALEEGYKALDKGTSLDA